MPFAYLRHYLYEYVAQTQQFFTYSDGETMKTGIFVKYANIKIRQVIDMEFRIIIIPDTDPDMKLFRISDNFDVIQFWRVDSGNYAPSLLNLGGVLRPANI